MIAPLSENSFQIHIEEFFASNRWFDSQAFTWWTESCLKYFQIPMRSCTQRKMFSAHFQNQNVIKIIFSLLSSHLLCLLSIHTNINFSFSQEIVYGKWKLLNWIKTFLQQRMRSEWKLIAWQLVSYRNSSRVDDNEVAIEGFNEVKGKFWRVNKVNKRKLKNQTFDFS